MDPGVMLFFFALIGLFILAVFKAMEGFTRSGVELSASRRLEGRYGALFSVVSLLLIAGLVAMIFASTRLFAFEAGPRVLQWSLGAILILFGIGCAVIGTRTRQLDICVLGIVLASLGIAFLYLPHLRGSRTSDVGMTTQPHRLSHDGVKPHAMDFDGWTRVIDESGDASLFPATQFAKAR